jgi:endonuclease III related protein
MPCNNKKMLNIYNKLLMHFGSQGWWPGDSQLEIILGTILTQGTNWKNAEKAIHELKKKKLIDPFKLHDISASKLEKIIRPAGYYKAKAKKIKSFINYLIGNYRASIKTMFNRPLSELRNELLSVWGIGNETADSILCYAGNKKSFVVDAYTVRIFNRIGLICTQNYMDIKKYFEKCLPNKIETYNEMHALLVALGKNYCKKARPICKSCPLNKKICRMLGVKVFRQQ